jgi:hypothetical protein
MNIIEALNQLRSERERLDVAIEALSGLGPESTIQTPPLRPVILPPISVQRLKSAKQTGLVVVPPHKQLAPRRHTSAVDLAIASAEQQVEERQRLRGGVPYAYPRTRRRHAR